MSSFDDQLRQTLESLADRVRDETKRQLASLTAELGDALDTERAAAAQQAAAEARLAAEQEGAARLDAALAAAEASAHEAVAAAETSAREAVARAEANVREAVARAEAAREAGRAEGKEFGKEVGKEIGREIGRDEGRQLGREEGRREGREEGLEQGREEGKNEGREEGRRVGWESGRQDGRQEGRAEGRREGRREGREEGRAESFALGREQGRQEGKAEGREEGRQQAREEGRQQGVEEGRQLGREEGRQQGLEEGRQLSREEGRQQGVEEGRQLGREEGRQQGLDEGRQLGREEAQQLGVEQGRQQALEEGRQLGLEEGRRQGEDAWRQGRDEGLEEGRRLGREQGIEEGRQQGRAEGIEVGRQEAGQVVGDAAREAARAELHAAELDANERLVDAIRAIDGARSLTEVLDTLASSAGREAKRVALLLLRNGRLRGWRFIGFGPALDEHHEVELSASEAGVLADAARTGVAVSADSASTASAPSFAELAPGGEVLAVPVQMSGQVVAVLYADQGPRDSQHQGGPPDSGTANHAGGNIAWPSTLELMARHAARCLESITAFRAAQVLTERPDVPASASSGARVGETRRPGSQEKGTDKEDAEQAARRYARLLVSEIKLYHESTVLVGRRERDLATRLGGEIARARVLYDQRVPRGVGAGKDYFLEELVRTLADGDDSLLQGKNQDQKLKVKT